ncbi:hypothetical protein [Paenibacillus arenilitoris]|uniref:Uncharacterized protein n=1 Tax=Paenibacillus arenilitoris TaxID=2772299 RepID=A0A927CIL0_9BACL|nr:hypothetical protein [Paenibacillus arenilitoris]MBD2867747.1 hypothetical protein [Paenibacillus arenilitoris]
MNDTMKVLRRFAKVGWAGKNAQHHVDETLAELELYLADNPEDEIARLQYLQYLGKKEQFGRLPGEHCDEASPLERHA